jgi:hypothetical protein
MMTGPRPTSPIIDATIESSRPLPGIRAGSALFPLDGYLLAVQDDAWDLVTIDPATGALEHWPLRGLGEALAKPEKPDLEAITALNDHTLAIFGSGSTPRRTSIALVDLRTREVAVVDAAPLYQVISDYLREPANIEGAAHVGSHLYLSHRGTTETPNRWIVVPAWWLTNLRPEQPARKPDLMGISTLPPADIQGVPLGVTDIAPAAHGMYLLGVAEATANAYDDGPVVGAAIGWCSEPGEPVQWTPIREADGAITRHKPEGLVVDADGRHAWAITDPDDADQPAVLLRLRLN